MFEIFTSVLLAVASIAMQAKTNTNFTYIAEAKTNSLASSVLAVEWAPETIETEPALIIVPDEFESAKVAKDEEGGKLSPSEATALRNEEILAIEGLIRRYSTQYSVSYEEMRRVMLCESSGKIDAVGDNGLAFGLYQFHENTFNMFAKDLGEKLEWKNPEHQIKLANWSFAHGKQTHWSCWKNI